MKVLDLFILALACLSSISYLAISYHLFTKCIRANKYVLYSVHLIYASVYAIIFSCQYKRYMLFNENENINFIKRNYLTSKTSLISKIALFTSFIFLSIFLVLPLYSEFYHALNFTFQSFNPLILSYISIASAASFELVFFDRFIKFIKGAKDSIGKQYNPRSLISHTINITFVFSFCSFFNVIQLPLSGMLNFIFPILTFATFRKELVSFLMTISKTLYDYGVSFNSIFNSLLALTNLFETTSNKVLLYIHLIAETAFSIGGQNKQSFSLQTKVLREQATGFAGITSEYIIDSISIDIDKPEKITAPKDYTVHIKQKSLLMAAIVGIILSVSNAPIIYAILIPSAVWTYYNFEKFNTANIKALCKSVINFNIDFIYLFCTIAAGTQGLLTALEFYELSSQALSRSIIAITTFATVVIERQVYGDLVKDFKKDVLGSDKLHHNHDHHLCNHGSVGKPLTNFINNYFGFSYSK